MEGENIVKWLWENEKRHEANLFGIPSCACLAKTKHRKKERKVEQRLDMWSHQTLEIAQFCVALCEFFSDESGSFNFNFSLSMSFLFLLQSFCKQFILFLFFQSLAGVFLMHALTKGGNHSLHHFICDTSQPEWHVFCSCFGCNG